MFLAANSVYCTVYWSNTTVMSTLGRTSVDILIATTHSGQFFQQRQHVCQRVHLLFKLYYGIEVSYVHMFIMRTGTSVSLPMTPEFLRADEGIKDSFVICKMIGLSDHNQEEHLDTVLRANRQKV